MIDWLNRINLFWTFIALSVFHLLLYYSLGTDNWFYTAMLATFVDTAVLAVLKYAATRKEKGR